MESNYPRHVARERVYGIAPRFSKRQMGRIDSLRRGGKQRVYEAKTRSVPPLVLPLSLLPIVCSLLASDYVAPILSELL